jgi:hypothetical protein
MDQKNMGISERQEIAACQRFTKRLGICQQEQGPRLLLLMSVRWSTSPCHGSAQSGLNIAITHRKAAKLRLQDTNLFIKPVAEKHEKLIKIFKHIESTKVASTQSKIELEANR